MMYGRASLPATPGLSRPLRTREPPSTGAPKAVDAYFRLDINRWTHAINTLDTYENICTYCNFSLIGPLYDQFQADGVNNLLCNKYCDIAMKEMGNINIVCVLFLCRFLLSL
jgi:hypothetical protein